MLTTDVPKIDELIPLILVENFDVIGLNETWLYTQNKNLLAEVVIICSFLFYCQLIFIGLV